MKRAAALVSLLFFPSILAAEAGRSAATLLTRTVGARSAALGQALTADAGEIDDIFTNPAGVARLPYPTASATYQNGLLDDSMGVVSYGQPISFGTWFVGFSAMDGGKININQSDGTTGSRRAEQDLSAQLGLAVGRSGPVSLGVSMKFLRSELAETATARSLAGDAGLYWETPIPGVQMAAGVQNVGQGLKYEQEKSPLPTSGRIGASYSLDLEESVRTLDFLKCRYLFLVDGVKSRNSELSYNGGLEIRKKIETAQLPGSAALRGGYVGATKAWSVGAGFTFWNVSLDYALNIINGLDNTHRVTLGYRFAPKPDVL